MDEVEKLKKEKEKYIQMEKLFVQHQAVELEKECLRSLF